MKNVNEVLIKNLDVQVVNLTKRHERAIAKAVSLSNEVDQIRGILASLQKDS